MFETGTFRYVRLQLGSRLDAVVSRLETQAKMQLINKNMAGIVKSLEKALNSNNLEQVRRLFSLRPPSATLRKKRRPRDVSAGTAAPRPLCSAH